MCVVETLIGSTFPCEIAFERHQRFHAYRDSKLTYLLVNVSLSLRPVIVQQLLII